MRLLKCSAADDDFQLTSFIDSLAPPYAILSHTWTDGQEVTYNELLAGTGKHKEGYGKLRFCSDRAIADGLEYCWIDTCCIDKSTSDELSTSINSMFRWHQGASKCYVFLTDVTVPDEVGSDASSFPITWEYAFRRSRWFTRGWTLQELLAPAAVEFFSQNGKFLGTKVSLEQEIHEITAIPVAALRGQRLSDFSIEERMSWSAHRTTSLREDRVYCLLGIFGIFLPLIYGEGKEYAALRLREEIEKRVGKNLRDNQPDIRFQSHSESEPPIFKIKRSFKSRSSLLSLNSFLRNLGLYVNRVDELYDGKCESGTRFSFGMCHLPSSRFIGWNALEITMTCITRDNKWRVSWGLQVQHRVSADSPIMMACGKGDVHLIRQVLEENRGGINDQAAISGRTPLMVAIYGKHLEAVQFLLQHGADPNIPDDDQILPIFAVAGMNPRQNQYFDQLPPTWEDWLATLRLLIRHGACPHEATRGRHLAGLNIASHVGSSKVLPFLRLLAAKDALDPHYIANDSRGHVLESAVKSGQDAVDALKLLHACGVNTSRVLANTQTALHLAAHHCQDGDALSYLLSTECALYINRQDQRGWAPLHYAILARTSADGPRPYSKAVLLLREGADTTIKARDNPTSSYHCHLDEFTGFELLKRVRYSRFQLLIETLNLSGLEVGAVVDAEDFYDAEEYHS